MIQSYEAMVEKDHIKWLGHTPEVKQAIRVLVIMETTPQRRGDVAEVLKKSRGVLSKKSIRSLDKQLTALRNDWNRE